MGREFGVIAGSCATENHEPRQVREEAAVVKLSVCCRVARLSFFQGFPILHLFVIIFPVVALIFFVPYRFFLFGKCAGNLCPILS